MAAIDLTTVQRVKDLLGNAATAGMDSLLAVIVTAASRWFMNRCGRRFLEATVDYTTDGDGTLGMSLPNGPVTAVSLVMIDGVAIDEIVTFGDTGWTLVGDRVELVNFRFCQGTANVFIRYTSGYTTVPEDLAHAATEMACWMFKNRDHYGIQQTTTVGANSITFRKDEPPFLVQVVADIYQARFGLALEGSGPA